MFVQGYLETTDPNVEWARSSRERIGRDESFKKKKKKKKEGKKKKVRKAYLINKLVCYAVKERRTQCLDSSFAKRFL
jgi:hypothetical protein